MTERPGFVFVFAVADAALSPDFAVGVELEVFIEREDAERLIEEVQGTTLTSRRSSGSRSASSRRAG